MCHPPFMQTVVGVTLLCSADIDSSWTFMLNGGLQTFQVNFPKNLNSARGLMFLLSPAPGGRLRLEEDVKRC